MSTATYPRLQDEPIRAWCRRLRAEGVIVEVKTIVQNDWPHVVFEDFFKHRVLDWLRTNVGDENYIWVARDFFFTKEEDAVMFKLMWSGAE